MKYNRIKSILLSLLITSGTFTYAQKAAPENWFNLDKKKDKIQGVSTERAYEELLKGKAAKKNIVVAVIDGGTEVAHEDLASVIWVNEKEIPNNGIDDDNNGYIDDINGWSFLGGPGGDVVEETLDATRVYRQGKDKYEKVDVNTLSSDEKIAYEKFAQAKAIYQEKLDEAKGNHKLYQTLTNTINNIQKHSGSENPTADQIKSYPTSNPMETAMAARLQSLVKKGAKLSEIKTQLAGALEYFDNSLKYNLNIDFNPRSKVGDNELDINERFYGCNRVSGPKGEHGTHVAGIIAAVRNNNIGINGVNNNVRIMVLRVVPDGDERDKDIANAIRYAVDNGAKIINMSFGKSISPHKKWVDDAVAYAAQKDVLLVHAAGNDGKNTDIENNFPRDVYADGNEAPNWIEVGASSWMKGKNTAAVFSNYGKQNVDVFAPGVDIKSCIPESKYATYDGTSMACPVTAGVASLVWSYYPQLTAVQVKQLILSSSIKVKGKVYLPGSGNKKKVKMTELCRTGGIVNAYEALKAAELLTKTN